MKKDANRATNTASAAGTTGQTHPRRGAGFAFLLGALLLPAISSCAGIVDRYVESITPRDLEEIKSLDLALLEYRFTPDPKAPGQIENRARALLTGSLPNREYKAEVLGIMGTALFYKDDPDNAARTASGIERESAAEPRLYVLRALLTRDRAKKLTILTDGLAKVERKGLVQLALAELWFDAGDYRKALAAFDEAFLSLPPRYRELYKKSRDLAFQLLDRPPAQAETRDLLAKNELAVGDVLTLTARETRFFDAVTPDPKISPAALYAPLLARGYLREGGPLLADTMTRKDVAFLLLRVLAFLENDPALLERHTGPAAVAAPSPVPDVQTTDFFYNAALVLVEREIMDLPDGRNFYPDRPMSGADYFEILKKLKQLYR